ncbi:MAG: hypothetical protein KatS3mg038_0671 [Candidatus Kapaibacterium sp.]|nr:MAG: hypothetical protein KatS3mg038_0671 [Candidatus Kapabacteria bacterium]
MQVSRVLRAVEIAERRCRCYWKGLPPVEWHEAFCEGRAAAFCYAAEHPRARTATLIWIAKRAMDAYLYRWDRERKSIRRLEVEWEDGEHASCTSLQWKTEDLSAEEGRRMDVRAALARLPASWQRVVVEALIEERPLAEIAERMGKTIGATKQMLFRARCRLRRQLAAYAEEYGGKSRDDSV